jgi:uncharacterized protein involved in exopolysaccharide biosynthesis
MSKVKRNKVVAKQEENLFIELISRYIFYWPLFLILIVVFVSGALVFIRYATPKYEATASMIIKDQKKEPMIQKQLNH